MESNDVTTDAVPLPRPWCHDCGPGYRMGDDGCRHDAHGLWGEREEPTEGETAICRTCALPIVFEIGQVGRRDVLGWSDRIKRGGDSVVCFSAVGYRHVPMGLREEAIYSVGLRAGRAVSQALQTAALLPASTLRDAWDDIPPSITPPPPWSHLRRFLNALAAVLEEADRG